MKKIHLNWNTPLTILLLMVLMSCSHGSAKKPSKGINASPAAKEASTTNDHNEKKDPPVKTKGSDSKVKSSVTKWNADAAKAGIKFSIKGPFGTVNGSFSGLISTIQFDKNNLNASSIRASTKTNSINTGNKLRNKDLQKEKYLSADKYPSISFQSGKIEKSGTGYKAIGELTIKGVTKTVSIPFNFDEPGKSGTFKGSFTIQRQDYGIGSKGGTIGNTITINLEVPVTRAG